MKNTTALCVATSALVFVVLAAGCSEGTPCTLIGCQDGFRLRVQRDDGEPPDLGAEIQLPERLVVCPPPSQLATAQRPCDPEVQVLVAEEQSCRDVVVGTTRRRTCQGTGRFEQVIELRGQTPATVTVTLLAGQRAVATRTFQPTYMEVYPNGPGCDRGCQQAQQVWTVEQGAPADAGTPP